MEGNIGQKTTSNVFESRPKVNLFNFCVFHPILIRFGLGANIGLERALNDFEMTMAIFLTDRTNQSKPTYSKSF